MAVQLIVNRGFESGTLLPGWRKTPGSATLDGGVTDATSHAGTYCLELRGMDFVEQAFTGMIARATGPLTFWTKAASALEVGPFYVNIKYNDRTSEPAFLVSPTTSWQRKTVAVDATKRLKCIQFSLGESGPVYVDDVSLSGSRILLVAAAAAKKFTSKAK